MTVGELITKLKEFPSDAPIAQYSPHTGGYYPLGAIETEELKHTDDPDEIATTASEADPDKTTWVVFEALT